MIDSHTANNKLVNTKSRITKSKTHANKILITKLVPKYGNCSFMWPYFRQHVWIHSIYLHFIYACIGLVSMWATEAVVVRFCCAKKFPCDEIVFGMWQTCAQWRMNEIHIDLLLSILMTFWTNFTFWKPHLTVWTKTYDAMLRKRLNRQLSQAPQLISEISQSDHTLVRILFATHLLACQDLLESLIYDFRIRSHLTWFQLSSA